MNKTVLLTTGLIAVYQTVYGGADLAHYVLAGLVGWLWSAHNDLQKRITELHTPVMAADALRRDIMANEPEAFVRTMERLDRVLGQSK